MAQPLDSGAFAALAKQWGAAEERIKHAGRVQLTLNTPAIKELRDAGFHLIRALEAPDKDGEREELNRALRHATRASYDAVESETLWLLEQIKRFQRDYRLIEIKVDGLDYQAIRRRARETRNLTLEANQNKESRDEHFTSLFGKCTDLAKDLDSLDDAREELNKKRRATRWKIASIATTVLVAAITAGCALYGHMKKATTICPPNIAAKTTKSVN